MNYFPFHVGDYAVHTRHLTLMEDLAYRRLLDLYYTRETALPADVVQVARLVGMREYAADVESVLTEFFELGDEGWRHERCDAEIAKMQDKQAKAQASAQASVNARKAKLENKSSDSSADVERTLNERSATVELPTPTPTPTPVSSVPIGTGSKLPLITNPEEIIFGYGLALLTNAGTTEKHARSFLGLQRKLHGDESLIDKLRDCAKAKPLQPLEWLAAALPPGGSKTPAKPGKHTGFDKLNYHEGIEADGSFA